MLMALVKTKTCQDVYVYALRGILRAQVISAAALPSGRTPSWIFGRHARGNQSVSDPFLFGRFACRIMHTYEDPDLLWVKFGMLLRGAGREPHTAKTKTHNTIRLAPFFFFAVFVDSTRQRVAAFVSSISFHGL